MLLNQFLILSAVLFSIGVYGVLARRNGVLVLMSIATNGIVLLHCSQQLVRGPRPYSRHSLHPR